jgi:hypothetical protein
MEPFLEGFFPKERFACTGAIRYPGTERVGCEVYPEPPSVISKEVTLPF